MPEGFSLMEFHIYLIWGGLMQSTNKGILKFALWRTPATAKDSIIQHIHSSHENMKD